MPELNHNHVIYDNFVLASVFEDQYESKLDLMQFCTVDDSLEGVAGEKKTINTYTATSGTQTLKMGEGNTKDIEVSYQPKTYTIELLQNRFPYYDEEAMIDPKAIEKGLGHMAVDMFNTANGKAMKAFEDAVLSAEVAHFDFDAFVDGVALFPNNEAEALTIFALVNPDDKAEIRKKLKDELKYVEAYVRTGYIGTVNAVNLYASNIAPRGTVILATKEAVTYFRKKGTEIEQHRDPNTRLNEIYSRQYGIFAFTDATKAVKLIKASIALDKNEATVAASSTVALTATTIPAGATVTWASDKTSVATVSSGTVTGVAAGTANITATITVDGKSYKDTCVVTVTSE